MDIAEAVAQLGGVAHKQTLKRLGARDIDLTRAVRRGYVLRARRGWYSTLSEADPRFLAVRIGGRLTGISAVAALGGWVLGDFPLHISVPSNASRLRSLGGRVMRRAVIHWDSADVGDRGTPTTVSVHDALVRVTLDEPTERAVAAMDWALRSGLVDSFDLASIALRSPRSREAVGLTDAACDSLPESLARTRLRQCGHSLRSQVPVRNGRPGERIDLLVDDIVGLEVDGDSFHRDRFEIDREKDESITLDELHAMRPSARSVFSRWERLHRAIHVALRLRCRGACQNAPTGNTSYAEAG